jgi:hypothetical protein
MARNSLATGLAILLAVALPAAPQGVVADPDVARGVKQVDEGDYDAAILTLDAAVRRLATERGRQAELGQAYLYLGVAYLAKGHETSAKARFRDALRQVRDLDLSPDRFAPRVIEVFEKTRDEVAPKPVERKQGGASKLPIVIGGIALAAGGVALAAGGGSEDGSPPDGGPRETSFPNEVLAAGAERPYLVTPGGPGNLTATLTWQQAGVELGIYIVALSNTSQVLATGSRTGSTERQLTFPVTAQGYRISVTHNSGQGAQVTATYTLRVQHP